MLITYELDPLPFLSERRQCSSQSTRRTKLQKEKEKEKHFEKLLCAKRTDRGI